MQTRTVDYEDERLKVHLVVRDATALVGMKRSILTRDGMRWLRKMYAGHLQDGGEDGAEPSGDKVPVGDEKKESDEDLVPGLDPESLEGEAVGLIAHRLLPDLVSCVVEVEGLDLEKITPADFIEFPDAFVDAWEAAVYELNRHWLGLPAEKKAEDPKELENGSNSE